MADIKEPKSLWDKIKKIMYIEINVPIPRILPKIKIPELAVGNILYEKEFFYSNLLMIVKKKLPLDEGLSNLRNFQMKSINPYQLSDSVFVRFFYFIIAFISFLTPRKPVYIKTRFPYIKYWSSILLKHIKRGAPLDEAMELCGGAFNNFEICFIKGGLKSGNLEKALLSLKQYYSNMQKVKEGILSNLAYPIVLFLVAGFIAGFILVKIVPKYADIFCQLGGELPYPTLLMIHITDLIIHKTSLFIVMLICFYIILKNLGLIQIIKRYIPFLSVVSQMNFLKRLLFSVGMQLKGGIPIDEALENTKSLSKDNWTNKKIMQLKTKVNNGKQFFESLKELNLIPHIRGINFTIISDMENLPDDLIDMAKDFDSLAYNKINKFLQYLEPSIHIILALIIAYFVIALYLPLFAIPKILLISTLN